MVGRRIGRFVILAPLGKGGMGSVWRAEDTLLGRPVAIKILADELAQDIESRRRFRREGEVAAQLDHPGICAVYEAGEQDGLTWLAMACIDGDTLSDRIRERLMPVGEVVRVGRMAADALAHAHARDVVHRDVTSRNIMVARDGRVVLLDFGLALVSEASRITGPGAVVGTIAYMAPELLCGQNATPRSDVYGLGVVLYEMLTGARPFESQNPEALRYQVLTAVPASVRSLRPEVPEALEAAVLKAMARRVEDRFETAEALLAALKACEVATSAAVDAPPAPRVKVRPTSDPARDGRAEPSADTAPVPYEAIDGTPHDRGARMATGRLPVYLAVLPVEDATGGGDAERARVLADLIETAAASLSDLERVRVVEMPAGDADLRTRARAAGVNLVLQSKARAVGGTLRLTFVLLDPETGTRLGGGTVDGSVLEPFRLEDRFVEAAADALSRSGITGSRRRRVSDPAAPDRLAQAKSYLERFDNEASLYEAVRLLEGLLESEGDAAPVLASLARAHLALFALTRRREHEAQATKCCEKAAAIDSGAPEVLLALAELHLVSGKREEALAACDRLLVLRPDDFDARLARVRAFDGLQRVDEAAAECRRAVALRPDDWRGHHVFAERSLRMGMCADAVAGWRRVTELCPDNTGAWRNLGAAYAQSDRLEDAVDAFRRSIAMRPSAMAYHNLGAVLFYLKRFEECREALEQGVALNPLNAVAWGNLGSACRFIPGQEGRMKEALERAIVLGREALARDPRSGEMWARLAGWLSNLGQHEQAVESVKKALAVSPHEVSAMVRAGFVYFGAGDRTSALHWIDESVRHGGGAEWFRDAPELAALEGDPEFTKILQRGATKEAS